MQPSPVLLHKKPTFGHEGAQPGDLDVKTGAGASLRRLFVIFNRGYKPMCFMAVDIDEALRIAFAVGHSRKSGAYRRWDDVTARAMEGADVEIFGEPPIIERALNAGRSGVWARTPENVWTLSGDPVD